MPISGEIRKGREIGRSPYNSFMFVPCILCGNPRWALLVGGTPRRARCYKCAGIGRAGELNHNWKGGRHKDKDGYILTRIDKDKFFTSMATRNKGLYVLEHRLVMAKHLGRCLHGWEIVHHKNHIRDDNRLENLQLISDNRHKQITLLENRISLLEKRVTLLESENILLREAKKCPL